ncbi:hypothetical protein [Cohnella faecalis]|uniref:Uncharacterized protein n=2 Tax=Cohnella faecalis TaxID=2315694 RepID=A0A398CMI2_9BACL|nr:hypothetical protein [Cohnella faecalis]RIE02449.1 hypothetical protein D3H35_17245 [Cohnella faecalis]
MLFFRECKKILFSVTFLLLIAGALLMTSSEEVLDFSGQAIEMPKPGQESYGMQNKDIPEIIMPAALQSLYREFGINSYTAYPIGFYKKVKLNENKQRQMADILSALTGIPADKLQAAEGGAEDAGFSLQGGELKSQGDGRYTIDVPDNTSAKNDAPSQVAPKDGIAYDDFKAFMKRANNLIGGGSSYSETYLIGFGSVPITYEEAVESYKLTKERDRFTGAYARLFADYILIILSVMPVFVAVAVSLKDKRAGISELIYTRSVSSAKVIATRYSAILLCVMVPVIALSYISNATAWKLYDGMTLNYFAPLQYELGWILPSVMISAAIGLFLTELTNTPIAIAVQGLWWFIDMNQGIMESAGGYSLLRLMPRHNSLSRTQDFLDQLDSLVANRLLMAGLALILIAATIVVYEQKRRGRFDGFGVKKWFAGMVNRQNKFAA